MLFTADIRKFKSINSSGCNDSKTVFDRYTHLQLKIKCSTICITYKRANSCTCLSVVSVQSTFTYKKEILIHNAFSFFFFTEGRIEEIDGTRRYALFRESDSYASIELDYTNQQWRGVMISISDIGPSTFHNDYLISQS